ncbi:MAG: biotin/lipoyl-binding protein [Armatimonadetes bacterium]|nr:biotin/lipoyl-binding protein [Armatimonadota bacterium]
MNQHTHTDDLKNVETANHPTHVVKPDSKGAPVKAAKSAPKPIWLRVLIIAALLSAVVVGGVVGLRYWHFSTTHVSTDNATLIGDVVQIAPQVSGTVEKVLVRDNQLFSRLPVSCRQTRDTEDGRRLGASVRRRR